MEGRSDEGKAAATFSAYCISGGLSVTEYILPIKWADIPWKQLNAHAKGHWRAKSNATKQLRAHVAGMVINERFTVDAPEVRLAFYMPNAIRRDTLNMAQSMKPAIDALVDQGIIERDDWDALTVGPMIVEIDRIRPRVVITIVSKNTPQMG